MDELMMPSLITATLSMDDRAHLREGMRPPLTWVTVWNVRGLTSWRQAVEFRDLLDMLTV